jgi:serine/threonine protein kinase
MQDESIFAVALEKSTPEERRAYLDEACAGNPDLRASVEELLRASDDAGSFLDHSPAAVIGGETIDAAGAADDTEKSAPGASVLTLLAPCDKPDRIGKLGPYEIFEVVGQGGMGAVLRALDLKLNRVVAVKVMAPELAANPSAVQRFLREARTAAAVHHEHVVTIHSVEESHRPPYLVMQYIEGQTLQQKVDREGALPLKQILRIGSQIAFGLAAAHKVGLIHRDVKPANILLENGVERVKITDFGLARAADDLEMTQAGLIAGTPQYMSPEQAQGAPIDCRSDLFSLGSVLYTMCTGRAAFRAETALGVLRRVCDEQPRPIQEINAEIPSWLAAIVDKLLAKNPAHRFESATEVAELLEQHLAHEQSPGVVPRPATLAFEPDRDRASALPVKPPPHASSQGVGVALVAILLAFFVLPVILAILAVAVYFFVPLGRPPARIPAPSASYGSSGVQWTNGNAVEHITRPALQEAEISTRQHHFIDLQPRANVAIAAGTRAGNNLAELGTGQKVLGGIPFQIGDNYLHLGYGEENLPQQIHGIAIGTRVHRLHFLHSTERTIAIADDARVDEIHIRDGVELARYFAIYDDGSQEPIPVVHGTDIRDWWNWDGSKPTRRGREVWRGSNPAIAAEQPGLSLRLFHSTWDNPHPDKSIRSLDYVRTAEGAAQPFCMAITAEVVNTDETRRIDSDEEGANR